MSAQTVAKTDTYVGEPNPNSTDGEVYRVEPDGSKTELDLRLDLGNHSPSGFSWGFQGSGPRQTAIAVLADAFGDEVAKQHSLRLVRSYFSTVEQDKSWAISKEELRWHLPPDADLPGGE